MSKGDSHSSPLLNKHFPDVSPIYTTLIAGYIDEEEIIKLTEKLGEKMTIEVRELGFTGCGVTERGGSPLEGGSRGRAFAKRNTGC